MVSACNDVGVPVLPHVQEQTRKDLAAVGKTYPEPPDPSGVRQMCEIGRIGKEAGKGFYDWGQGADAKVKACGASSPRCTRRSPSSRS